MRTHPRLTTSNREYAIGLARAFAGALLFALPLLMTMEMWSMSGVTGRASSIEVRATGIAPSESGFVVEIAAANRSGVTAAIVEEEGLLKSGETVVETSKLTFDYVPGHAVRRRGLFFTRDPRRHRLELRPRGYQEP